MKKFFTSYLLWVIFALINSNVLLAQYSNATLNGPWFGYLAPLDPYNNQTNYTVFDGDGNIIDGGQFHGPTSGSYSVNSTGAFTGNLITDGQTIPFYGQLNSKTDGDFVANGMNFKIHKIANPGALKVKITGEISSTSCGSRTVTLYIDSNGNVNYASGLAGPVSAKIYSDLGIFYGHFTTGETAPWNEFSIKGTYTNNTSLTGKLELNTTICDINTTNVSLTRSDDIPPNTLWTSQTNPLGEGGSTMVGKVQFVSATEGWISISPGGLLHTTDAGANWAEVTSPFRDDVVWSISDPAVNMSFINTTTGWIMKSFGTDFSDSYGAVVYKTTDGGANWQKTILTQNAGDIGVQIQFIDTNIGWASYGNQNGNYTLYKTTNGGTTWNPILTSASSIPFFFFHFIDSNNGWASSADMDVIGQTAKIYHTTDGGENWTLQLDDTTIKAFSPITFIDLNNGWVVGDLGKILKTTDGGLNWTAITNAGLTINDNATSVYFKDANRGWIGIHPNNDRPYVLQTLDGGANWTKQTTPLYDEQIFSLFFWDENNGWYTADYGRIAHYSKQLGVKENIVNKIITIYPNPTNSKFCIDLKEPKSKMEVEIYNVWGQKIYESSTLLPQSTNEINFIPKSKGIYFIKINDGENSYTEKIIIQ